MKGDAVWLHMKLTPGVHDVQIWDVGRMKQIRALKGHSARVSALAWSGTTLSSGGRDSNIINHDVRCAPDQDISSSPQPHPTTFRQLCCACADQRCMSCMHSPGVCYNVPER